jgi:hypothetical protein
MALARTLRSALRRRAAARAQLPNKSPHRLRVGAEIACIDVNSRPDPRHA